LILLKDKESDKVYKLYIIDAHHHVGKEKNIENKPSDVYRFFDRIENYILSKFEKLSSRELERYRFIPIKVEPSISYLTTFLEDIPSWRESNIGWLVDKSVVFPLNDIYAYTTDVAFEKSNRIISSITTKLPDSLRLYGFARVDPKDGLKAAKEFQKSISELKLRGLKLHPISQMFIDRLLGEEVISLTCEATKFNVPVIIDARFIATARRIKELAIITSEKVTHNKDSQPKIIIAHCGRSFGNPELFSDILSNKFVYGETSTLSGSDIPIFYELASEILGNVKNIEDSWSSKIIFGTDSPLMGEIQAIEHLMFLFTYDFYSITGGGFFEIQQILAGNILRLIPYPVFLSPSENDKKVHAIEFTSIRDFENFMKAIMMSAMKGEINIISVDNLIGPYGSIVYDNKIILSLFYQKSKVERVLFIDIDESESIYRIFLIPSEMLEGVTRVADYTENKLYRIYEEYILSEVNYSNIKEFLMVNDKINE